MRQERTQRSVFHQPDAAAMELALKRNQQNSAGIILLLAWKAGLVRNEISALTWAQTDPDAALLRLPDREIPLEEQTAEALRQWKAHCGDGAEYVAASRRAKAPMSGPRLSGIARRALDDVGLEDVTLKDLRYDFIRREIETHGLPRALRVAGISLTSYNSSVAKILESGGFERIGLESGKKERKQQAPQPENEYLLWKIMQANRQTPGGIAIWLIQQMGLRVSDVALLTWDDVDFEAGVLRLRGEELPLAVGTARILSEERARRAPGDDPHVILSPRARKPITEDRLSVLIRETLIRGGLDDLGALDIRMGMLREIDWKILRSWVDERGAITPRETGRLLGLTDNLARSRLQALERAGYLVHVGRRYYAADRTPPEDRLKEAVEAYIAEHGSISCKEAWQLLNIPPRQIGYILRRMAKDGELAASGRGRYVLPGGR